MCFFHKIKRPKNMDISAFLALYNSKVLASKRMITIFCMKPHPNQFQIDILDRHLNNYLILLWVIFDQK